MAQLWESFSEFTESGENLAHGHVLASHQGWLVGFSSKTPYAVRNWTSVTVSTSRGQYLRQSPLEEWKDIRYIKGPQELVQVNNIGLFQTCLECATNDWLRMLVWLLFFWKTFKIYILFLPWKETRMGMTSYAQKLRIKFLNSWGFSFGGFILNHISGQNIWFKLRNVI